MEVSIVHCTGWYIGNERRQYPLIYCVEPILNISPERCRRRWKRKLIGLVQYCVIAYLLLRNECVCNNLPSVSSSCRSNPVRRAAAQYDGTFSMLSLCLGTVAVVRISHEFR